MMKLNKRIGSVNIGVDVDSYNRKPMDLRPRRDAPTPRTTNPLDLTEKLKHHLEGNSGGHNQALLPRITPSRQCSGTNHALCGIVARTVLSVPVTRSWLVRQDR